MFVIEVGSLLILEGGGEDAGPRLLKFNVRKRMSSNSEEPEKCSRFTTFIVSVR